MSQVIGWGFALIFAGAYALSRLNVYSLRDKLRDAREQLDDITCCCETPVIEQGIDCGGLSDADVAVIRANYLDLTDEERADLEAAFVEAIRLFHGSVPYVPGPYDITEGEEHQ